MRRFFKSLAITGIVALALLLLFSPAIADEQREQDCRMVATYIGQPVPDFALEGTEHSAETAPQSIQLAIERNGDKQQRLDSIRGEVIKRKAETGIAKVHLWNAFYQKKCADSIFVAGS